MPKTILNGKVYGTDDYADLQNKPQIGGVELTGDKSAATMGLVAASEKGAANGVATLDSGGKVPSAQLPAYVDDVLEYANLAEFPATGSSGVLYVAVDTDTVYRWSGSTYTAVSTGSGALTLGETASTAYRGDKGKTAYDHSQIITGNPHGTVGGDISLTLTDAAASTTLPVTTASNVGTLIQSIRNNLKALLGYFTSGILKIANGGTGVATVAGQSATQRKVFASPASTTAAAPSFATLTPADIGLTATTTELDYVDGVTSAIQTQLDAKAASASLGSLATKSTIVNADVDEAAAIATSKVAFTVAQTNALNSGITSTIVGKAIQNDGAASKVVTIAVVASLPSTPAADTLYLVG